MYMQSSDHVQCIGQQRGFTLLETVIAIGIILFGLLSMLLLSTVTLFSGKSTSEEFIAANFAQEGIEAVRSIRDSNWLAYDTDSTTSWQSGLTNTQTGQEKDYSAILLSGQHPADHRLDFTTNDFTQMCDSTTGSDYECAAIWYDSQNHQYFQTNDPSFNSSQYSKTAFSRIIQLYPLCYAESNGGIQTQRLDTDATHKMIAYHNIGAHVQLAQEHNDALIAFKKEVCAPIESDNTHIGVDAVVTVQWVGRGGVHQYVVEEKIYNWKYE